MKDSYDKLTRKFLQLCARLPEKQRIAFGNDFFTPPPLSTTKPTPTSLSIPISPEASPTSGPTTPVFSPTTSPIVSPITSPPTENHIFSHTTTSDPLSRKFTPSTFSRETTPPSLSNSATSLSQSQNAAIIPSSVLRNSEGSSENEITTDTYDSDTDTIDLDDSKHTTNTNSIDSKPKENGTSNGIKTSTGLSKHPIALPALVIPGLGAAPSIGVPPPTGAPPPFTTDIKSTNTILAGHAPFTPRSVLSPRTPTVASSSPRIPASSPRTSKNMPSFSGPHPLRSVLSVGSLAVSVEEPKTSRWNRSQVTLTCTTRPAISPMPQVIPLL